MRLDTDLGWRDLNPNQSNTHARSPNAASGGRVNGLSAASDKSVIFAATEWGGLYRSADTGRTWNHVPTHLPPATWQVAVDPTNARRVYATSFYDGRVWSLAGINVSTDGGLTWMHPPSAAPPAGFCDSVSRADNPSAFGIAIDPDHAERVFVGTNCGLIRSTDSGATWTHVYPATGQAVDVWSIVVHRGVVDICGEDGHSRSVDGGTTWTTNDAVPLPSGRCSITASPLDATHLIATVGPTIYQSLDGGNDWQALDSLLRSPDTEPGRIGSVAVNARTDSTFDLWYGYGNLFRGTCSRAACPRPAVKGDSLSGWQQLGTSRGAHLDVGMVLFDPAVNRNACPMLLSNDGGIEVNAVSGGADCQSPQWKQPDKTPHALWVLGMQLALVPSKDSTVRDTSGGVSLRHTSTVRDYHRIVFGTQDNGAFQTDRANADTVAWDNTDPADVADAVGGTELTLNSVCCYPEKRLFLRNIGAGAIMRDTVAQPLPPPFGATVMYSTGILAQVSARHFAMLTSGGLLLSYILNGDTTWYALGWPPAPIPRPTSWTPAALMVSKDRTGPVFFVRIDSTDAPSQLWALTGVSLSVIARPPVTGAGWKWHRITPPGNVGGFGVVAVDRSNPKRIFASHEKPGSDPRMMLSVNGGSTWKFLPALDACMTGNGDFRYRNERGPTGIGAGKNGFGGYSQPTLVAFGAEADSGRVLVAGAADAGVFFSGDGGTHWNVLSDQRAPQQSGRPFISRPLYVRLVRSPLGTSFYFGAQGYGVWTVRVPTRQYSGAGLPHC